MKKLILTTILALAIIVSIQAQRPGGGGGKGRMPEGNGKLTGKIVDSNSGNPMKYANVVVYKLKDTTMVTGAITDDKGVYMLSEVPYGRYLVKIKFIGYDVKQVTDVIVTPKAAITDMGTIKLNPDANNISEISVQADQTPVLYHLDRKIVKVSSNLSATGGSAVDALDNTPSVNVDIEGNVSLRGSSNFQVLIDGKPSAFTGSDALEMIPVSTIEQIEVITNPSAKYDPEGTAGIINVITKKRALEGTSAMLSVSGDTNGSMGGDLTVNYKTEKVNYYVGVNYNDRSRSGYRESDNYTMNNDTTFYTSSGGDRNGGHIRSGVKFGADYYLSTKGTLSAGINYGQMQRNRNSYSDYQEWTLPETIRFNSLSNDFSDHTRDNYSVNLDYVHKFNNFGHELKLSSTYKIGTSLEENGSEQFDVDDQSNIISGKTSSESGEDNDFRFKADYTLPVSETGKLEAGYQLRAEKETEKYDVTYFGNLDLLANDELGNTLNSEYTRQINSVYGIYSNEYKKLGYQIGLRGEYTDRLLINKNDGSEYTIDQFDYFPSLHLSLQLPADMQMLASYSRRIDRPRNYYLEPFLTWRDAYTVWQGNPGLKPEYIDSYELSLQKKYGKSYVSLEVFHRKTNDKSERVRSVFEGYNNVLIHSIANVGDDYSTGAELMLNLNLKKWWNFNVSSSAYHYLIKSDVFDTDNEDITWYVRGRTSFILPWNLRLQFDGNYSAPSVTAQGSMEGFYMFGSSIRADFMDRKLSVNFKVSDMFGTGKHEFVSSGEDFYSRMLFQRDAPVFGLSVSYKFNNYKEKRGGSSDGMMDGGDMDF